MVHNLYSCLWLPCMFFTIPVYYKLPEGRTQALGLVPTPDPKHMPRSPNILGKTYWYKFICEWLSKATLLLSENVRKPFSSTQGYGEVARICFCPQGTPIPHGVCGHSVLAWTQEADKWRTLPRVGWYIQRRGLAFHRDGQALLFWANVNNDYVNKAPSPCWLFKPLGKWLLSFLIRTKTLSMAWCHHFLFISRNVTFSFLFFKRENMWVNDFVTFNRYQFSHCSF